MDNFFEGLNPAEAVDAIMSNKFVVIKRDTSDYADNLAYMVDTATEIGRAVAVDRADFWCRRISDCEKGSSFNLKFAWTEDFHTLYVYIMCGVTIDVYSLALQCGCGNEIHVSKMFFLESDLGYLREFIR
jgi:hypothetical protein